MPIIRQALRAIDQQQLEQASLYSKPTARFASIYCNSHSKGSPFTERQFNSAEFMLWHRDMSEAMNKSTARIIQKAFKAGKIPGFVRDWIDVEAVIEFAKVPD